MQSRVAVPDVKLASRTHPLRRYRDMTKADTTNFILHSLPAGEVDVSVTATRRLLAEHPAPCRRCLRNAEIGDALLLAPYDPFTVRSPYAGEGPVFVHAGDCDAHQPSPGAICEQVSGRVLSVRAYDADAMLLGAEVLAGEQLAERATAMLAAGGAFLHVHFAGPGCFAFRIDPV
jgi:hypothetical protein